MTDFRVGDQLWHRTNLATLEVKEVLSNNRLKVNFSTPREGQPDWDVYTVDCIKTESRSSSRERTLCHFSIMAKRTVSWTWRIWDIKSSPLRGIIMLKGSSRTTSGLRTRVSLGRSGAGSSACYCTLSTTSSSGPTITLFFQLFYSHLMGVAVDGWERSCGDSFTVSCK